jgi:hypothetical protein
VALPAEESWEGFWRIISKTVVGGGYMVTSVTRVCLAEGFAGRQFNIVFSCDEKIKFCSIF